jgi:hypothetical protein
MASARLTEPISLICVVVHGKPHLSMAEPNGGDVRFYFPGRRSPDGTAR